MKKTLTIKENKSTKNGRLGYNSTNPLVVPTVMLVIPTLAIPSLSLTKRKVNWLERKKKKLAAMLKMIMVAVKVFVIDVTSNSCRSHYLCVCFDYA